VPQEREGHLMDLNHREKDESIQRLQDKERQLDQASAQQVPEQICVHIMP
jgi:hypothetical protein